MAGLHKAATLSETANRTLMLDIERAGDRLVAVGDRGYVLLSDDSGSHWRQAQVPVSVMLTAVQFVDDKYGWAVGHGGVVIHTQDGGETWTLQLDGNRINDALVRVLEAKVTDQETRIESLSDEQREEAEFALEELQFLLDDARISVEEGPTKPLLDIWFRNHDEGLAIGAYGLILKTRDGGASWTAVSSSQANPDGFHYNQMALLNDGSLVMVGEAGGIYRSSDQGESWEALESPYQGSFFGLQRLGDGQSLIVYGLRGNAFLSRDKGETWDPVDVPGHESIMASALWDQGLVLLGGNGSVWGNPQGRTAFKNIPVQRALPIAAATWAPSGALAVAGHGGIRLIDVQAGTQE